MRPLLVLVLAVAACGDKSTPLGPTDQAGLAATLDALAQFGEKRAGSPAGAQAAAYIQGRFTDLGLTEVHLERFQFPSWLLASSSLTVTIDGAPISPGYDVFEAAGPGTVDGDVVDVGTATDSELVGVDLTGKVALVRRTTSFHRSAQLRNVIAAGGAAMLYLSVAPDNLRQVGSVRFGWEAATAIPAVTVGAIDGATITDALGAGKAVRAQLDVATTVTPGIGANVVGVIQGDRPETIVLGAHYDSWFTGSSDNGSGVAELLAVAERQRTKGKPHYTLVFVAYDGEELGLYGGYDYLRKHKIVARDPILAVINFESPSANNPDLAGLAHSNQPKLDEALQKAHLRQIYGVYAGLEIVAQLFGGIIPTDIQGVYRGGVPTVTTAVTNPYYHTKMDTPDKVDLQLLGDSSDGFDAAIDYLQLLSPADFAVPDHTLWTAEVTATGGADLAVTATVRDGTGAVMANAHVIADVMHDDFSLAGTMTGVTDGSGQLSLAFPPGAATMGMGNRFLHVTAGPTYPLAETIVALP